VNSLLFFFFFPPPFCFCLRVLEIICNPLYLFPITGQFRYFLLCYPVAFAISRVVFKLGAHLGFVSLQDTGLLGAFFRGINGLILHTQLCTLCHLSTGFGITNAGQDD